MTQAYIKIKVGSYRNQDVIDTVFPLIKQFQVGANGGFVTVDGSAKFGPEYKKIRVKVAKPTLYEMVSEADYIAQGDEPEVSEDQVVAHSSETDEEVLARLTERFGILDEMSGAAIAGDIRAMIVSGPPGVGKSYGTERQLEKAALFDTVASRRIRSEIIKGSITPIGLYCTLYKYSDPGSVLVFDDCDTVLADETSLNLLKGALDTGKKRRISWLADSHMLRKEGVPDSFDFKGSVIFITNLDFANVKSNKLRPHLDALMSRCHYLDLTMSTMREKMLWINHLATSGDLFEGYDFDPGIDTMIMDFMMKYRNSFRELSLRTVLKVADLYKMSPTKWEALARTTCMK